jgi:hypothetical protein
LHTRTRSGPNFGCYTPAVIKRYAVASAIIMTVALATAGLAYAAGSKLTYSAFCTAEVFVRAPATALPAANPDFLAFTNSLAANEVASASPTVFQQLAQEAHLSTGALAGTLLVTPAPGIGAFRVTVTDTDLNRTKRIARSACPTFVGVIVKQRADEINRDVTGIEGRLKTIQAEVKRLQAIPPKKRTPEQIVSLITQQEALKLNAFLIASLRSLPPDNITVLTPATSVTAMRSISLKRYALIALVAGLLAIFLFILVSEALSSPNRRDATAGDAR